MANDGISLTQDEIDKVLNGVRSDNAANDKAADGEAGVAISQSELDKLFGGGAVKKMETPQMTTAEKLAARRAKSAEILAKANASSPKEITVVYGKTKSTGAAVVSFKPGTVIELDRPDCSAVDIMCDGKLIAKGFAGKSNGNAAVKISVVYK